MKAKFLRILKPVLEKIHFVPINLQNKTYKKLNRITEEGRITKLQECFDKKVFSARVTKMKTDGRIYLTLESKEFKKQIKRTNTDAFFS